MNLHLKLALSAALALPLVGCSPPRYQVKVNNRADQPVTAELWGRTEGTDRRRVARFIGPQDSHTLWTEGGAGQNVWLSVDFAGNEGAPEQLPLSRGMTVINVHRVEEGGRGRIRLEEVP